MKSLVPLTMISLLMFSVGCGVTEKKGNLDGEKGAISISGIQVESAQPSIAPLDKEAAELAVDFWKPTRIGESCYLRFVRTLPDPPPAVNERTLYELRNVHALITPEAVSPADRLNGIEWQGKVDLLAEVSREYPLEPFPSSRYAYFGSDIFGSSSAGRPKTWSKWQDCGDGRPVFSASMTKTSGNWGDIGIPDIVRGNCWEKGMSLSCDPVAPADIPK